MAEDRTYETTETSEYSDAEHSSERSFHETKILVHGADRTGKETDGEDEHFEDFKTKVEIMVELGSDKLRTFSLSDCYTSDRPGMHLEILPKIIFDSVDDETDLDEIDLPKPIYRRTADYGTQLEKYIVQHVDIRESCGFERVLIKLGKASIEFKSDSAQTLRSNLVNSWSQYEPRLCTDEEITQNITSPSFQSFKDNAEESILGSIAQNSIADSFFWDLTSLYDELPLGKETKPTLISGSFSCSESDNEERMISSIDWHPIYKDIFIASTINCLSFEQRTKGWLECKSDSVLFYMWSAKNQFFPKLMFEYFNDIQILKFNTSIPNLIAGGSLTGQLVLWDMRKEASFVESILQDDTSTSVREFTFAPVIRCCAICNIDHIHKHGITDLQWIPKNFEVSSRGNVKKNSLNISYQIVTCGLDGFLQFWDLRTGLPMKGHSAPKKFHHLDNVWEPFHTIEVFAPESRKRKALTCFTLRSSYIFDSKENSDDIADIKLSGIDVGDSEIDAMSTEFYGGCDDGQILCGNFKLIRDDAGKFIVRYPDYYKSPHNSSISVLACSPFIQDAFLSAGGKCFAIWEHNIKAEPVYLRQRSSYITSGEWSPSRPAVFILGFIDGSVEVWDLLNNLYEPYLFHYMATSAIKSTSIQSISETEYIIVAGDAKGVVYSMTLLPELWIAEDNEFEKTKQLIEIQATAIRKNIPESLADSIVPETVKPSEQSEKVAEPFKIETEDQDILAENYETFLNLQKQQLKYLGLLKEDESIELITSVSYEIK